MYCNEIFHPSYSSAPSNEATPYELLFLRLPQNTTSDSLGSYNETETQQNNILPNGNAGTQENAVLERTSFPGWNLTDKAAGQSADLCDNHDLWNNVSQTILDTAPSFNCEIDQKSSGYNELNQDSIKQAPKKSWCKKLNGSDLFSIQNDNSSPLLSQFFGEWTMENLKGEQNNLNYPPIFTAGTSKIHKKDQQAPSPAANGAVTNQLRVDDYPISNFANYTQAHNKINLSPFSPLGQKYEVYDSRVAPDKNFLNMGNNGMWCAAATLNEMEQQREAATLNERNYKGFVGGKKEEANGIGSRNLTLDAKTALRHLHPKKNVTIRSWKEKNLSAVDIKCVKAAEILADRYGVPFCAWYEPAKGYTIEYKQQNESTNCTSKEVKPRYGNDSNTEKNAGNCTGVFGYLPSIW